MEFGLGSHRESFWFWHFGRGINARFFADELMVGCEAKLRLRVTGVTGRTCLALCLEAFLQSQPRGHAPLSESGPQHDTMAQILQHDASIQLPLVTRPPIQRHAQAAMGAGHRQTRPARQKLHSNGTLAPAGRSFGSSTALVAVLGRPKPVQNRKQVPLLTQVSTCRGQLGVANLGDSASPAQFRSAIPEFLC